MLADRVRGWAREPLVHFLLAGALIFLFSAWRGEPVDPGSRTIQLDEARVTALTERFALTWQRPPTAQEIDELIRDAVKEEIYYREALRLGLDADDMVIRRRLRAKMEFLARSQVEAATPDEATLQDWLDRNPNRYAPGARLSFDQIYLSDKAMSEAEVRPLLASLDQTNGRIAAEKQISLPRTMDKADRQVIAREFGEEFAGVVFKLPAGRWSGPVTSAFGSHAVRVREVVPGSAPKLADVRQRVENDWRAETAKAREAKVYQTLLDGYTIKIAKP